MKKNQDKQLRDRCGHYYQQGLFGPDTDPRFLKLLALHREYDGVVPVYIPAPMTYLDEGEYKFRTVFYLVDFLFHYGHAICVYRARAPRRDTNHEPRREDLCGREYIRWPDIPARLRHFIRLDIYLWTRARYDKKATEAIEQMFKGDE